ncbi:alpha/beta hydrolase [Paenibacillus whitsoniae]|nr:alpha/beta hydrolase [Paenibacillus whitsoniae]
MSTTSYTPTPGAGALQPTLPQTVIRPLLRRKTMILSVLLALLLIVSSMILSFYAYVAWTLARPHIDQLTSNPMKASKLAYTNVTFPSLSGNSELEGWFIPSADATKTVIFSHGYGGNREEIWVPLYKLASKLHEQKYNVLMFDYGYVKPYNNRLMTGGIQESQELLGAIDYVKKTTGGAIYIWGFSMGAGTALQSALQNNTDIAGMILDSTFLLNPDTLYHNIVQIAQIPKYPSLPLIRFFFPILNGVSLHEVPYQKVASTSYSMPIFFIHGTADKKAPYDLVESLYKQQHNTASELWILPKAEHELLYRAEPRAYVNRTLSFLNSLGHPPTNVHAASGIPSSL